MTAPQKTLESPDGQAGQSLGAAPCSASAARDLIVNRVCPWEVIGDVSFHDDGEWRALVTLTPSGPLMLMGFKISAWEMPNEKAEPRDR